MSRLSLLTLGTALCLALPLTVSAAAVNDGFIRLEGGTVTLGSPADERQRGADEAQHSVTLSPFFVDPYEVTQADYARVMGVNPSHFKGERHPVENVTWYDAIEYCNRLSAEAGLTPVYTQEGNRVTWNRAADGYRLLTEAEWEYAARAGTSTIYYCGNQVHSDVVNFEGSYPYLIEENYVRPHNPDVVTSRFRDTTLDVGELAPNPFGLYDILGNVSEWVFDYWGEYPDEARDPTGPAAGTLRVSRGGAYNDFGKHLRSAYRSAVNPLDADQNQGFRLARNAVPMEGSVTTVYTPVITRPANPRLLVAYFSYTGNSQNAAEIIAGATGASLHEISMEHPYRGNIYEVSQRDLMQGNRPPLATRVENMDEYDVILLGYPTWWATLPMPVLGFIESYDLSGKMILPFNSHGGTMFGDSVSDLSKAAKGAYVAPGVEFHYSGGSDLDEKLYAWLLDNGIAVSR